MNNFIRWQNKGKLVFVIFKKSRENNHPIFR